MSNRQENRLRCRTSVDVMQWLATKGHGFGDQEPFNRGNFIEMIKYLASVSVDVRKNLSENDYFASLTVQRDILDILAKKVRDKILEELGEAKFCVFIDEAFEDFDKYQIAIILRFVDREGFVRERLVEIVDVQGFGAITFKEKVSNALVRYNLRLIDVRGQGYDGASKLRNSWDELQTLFLKDCLYAYYVHCFAHPLESAFIAASEEVYDVYAFFKNLNSIVKLVGASLKPKGEGESEEMVPSGELDSGRGSNEICSQQSEPALSSSTFTSIRRLMDNFNATTAALQDLVDYERNVNISAPARGALRGMSFEFVFVLHLMNEIMRITHLLCRVSKRGFQSILNVLCSVPSTKRHLQELKENGWSGFWESLVSFCEKHHVNVPDMSAYYWDCCRSHEHDNLITIGHHYHIDVFDAVIDLYLKELESRFSDQTVKLLTLSSALDPSNGFRSFKIDDICSLAREFYPQDFTEHELQSMEKQLQQYYSDVCCDSKLQNISSLSELCQLLYRTRKNQTYFLIDRLIRLVLTLPVSTATTERMLSAIQTAKTKFWDEMEEGFLANCIVLYIEREFTEGIDPESIVDEVFSRRGF